MASEAEMRLRARLSKLQAGKLLRGTRLSGELERLYTKWFVAPIPPKNTKVGLPASDATKAAWANPNDKPLEEYAKK